MWKCGLLASPTDLLNVGKFLFHLPASLLQHTMHIILFSEWTIVWGNTVSFGFWRAELTGPTPQQNTSEIKKQTETIPAEKKCWGQAKKFIFCVARKANLISYCNTKLDFFFFLLLLKLKASLLSPAVKGKISVYLKYWKVTAGRNWGKTQGKWVLGQELTRLFWHKDNGNLLTK